jgi:hypothetical protein
MIGGPEVDATIVAVVIAAAILNGAVGYGFAVMSAQVDHREFASRFHGSDERIDVESLRLTTEAWGILAREFCG